MSAHPTPYAEQVASAQRLDECGGDYDLFLERECERIDRIMAPLKVGRLPLRGTASPVLRTEPCGLGPDGRVPTGAGRRA